MKILTKIICLAVLVTLSFTSCKRCVKCRVDYFTPDAKGNTFYEQNEACGNAQDIKRERDNMETAYKSVGNVSCPNTKATN